MVYLLKEVQGQRLFYLIKGKEYVVGRKNADIMLSDDQSISRKHAVIKIGNNVTLKDYGSKYGTFHNSIQLTANSDMSLNDKDTIKFGVFQNIYRFEKIVITTTGSGLTDDQKKELKSKIHLLGGSVVNNWNEHCTHLTSQEILLTVKVLHAIIDEKPIVTLEYWSQFVKNLNSMTPPPNVEDFKPPIAEALMNTISLAPNPGRKVLFKGKIFVFTTEKIKRKMADLITKTGATSISWERHAVTLLDITKSKNKYLFIPNDSAESVPRSWQDMVQHLTKLGERTIPIQEIATAIVVCSSEKDCNPKFDRLHNVFKMPLFNTCSTVVENTPSDDGWLDQAVPKTEVVIPESVEAELDLFPTPTSTVSVVDNPPSTSKRIDNESDNNPSKRIKLDPPTSGGQISKNGFTSPESGSAALANVVEEIKKESINLDDSMLQQSTSGVSNSMERGRSSVNVLQKQEKVAETRKRKSGEDWDFATKRPFAVTKKKRQSRNVDNEENPFIALRVNQELTEADYNNPFLQLVIRPQKPEPVLEPLTEITPLAYAKKNYVVSNPSNISWTSISDIKNEDSVINGDIAPELREVFEKFKNTVVIEVLPKLVIRTVMPNSTVSSLDSSTSRKNFKKFKKVRPRHPQITILTTSIYDEERIQEIVLSSDGEEPDEQERSVRRPIAKKSAPKHFEF